MADVTSSESTTTDYEIGQDNIQIMGLDIHNPVFLISSVTIVAFVIFGYYWAIFHDSQASRGSRR